jgi:hypothetical protein
MSETGSRDKMRIDASYATRGQVATLGDFFTNSSYGYFKERYV